MSILRIKTILKEKSIKSKDFALDTGITENSLSLIVNGKRQPKYETLLLFAEKLNVDIRDLFESTKVSTRLRGYVEYNEVVYKITSKEDLENLLNSMNQE